MLLTFSKDRFMFSIKAGRKIHTIREDNGNRWKEGMKIHLWRGNPRNVRQNPYSFGEKVCTSVQKIAIHADFGPSGGLYSFVKIDGRQLKPDEVEKLAVRDGFSSARQFYKWFGGKDGGDFFGKIIHWTDFQY